VAKNTQEPENGSWRIVQAEVGLWS